MASPAPNSDNLATTTTDHIDTMSLPTFTDAELANMGSFGRLPGEIRNRIYRLAFGPIPMFRELIEVTTYWKADKRGHRLLPRQPGLARTCRLMRHEVLSIYYGERIFSACIRNSVPHHGPSLTDWAQVFGQTTQYFRKIELYIELRWNISPRIHYPSGASIELSMSSAGHIRLSNPAEGKGLDVQRGLSARIIFCTCMLESAVRVAQQPQEDHPAGDVPLARVFWNLTHLKASTMARSDEHGNHTSCEECGREVCGMWLR
jgi:hypothetical protein